MRLIPAFAALVLMVGCMPTDSRSAAAADAAAGELAARPTDAPTGAALTGLSRLDQRGERATLLYVPTGYRTKQPATLVLMLHGAGGVAAHAVGLIERYAETRGVIVLAPTSQAVSWDIIVGRRYGPDVRAIDGLLADVFARYAIDPARVGIGGFSDGASYALSLGLTNGDLFDHVIAFSPGFMAPARDGPPPNLHFSRR